MKKFCISLILLAIIFVTITAGNNTNNQKSEYLRIHIRANSNDSCDQEIKFIIKDLVVEYLTPYIANCQTKNQAIGLLNAKKPELISVINKALKLYGFNYQSNIKIDSEEFPLRVYEGVTLESGFYDAVIVELGKAEGDNWWCVMYPPLCFYGEETEVKYKSKIKEIIDKFFLVRPSYI